MVDTHDVYLEHDEMMTTDNDGALAIVTLETITVITPDSEFTALLDTDQSDVPEGYTAIITDDGPILFDSQYITNNITDED